MKWEYMVQIIGTSGAEYITEDELNELGAKGWELVVAIVDPGRYGCRHIFKRQVV